MIKSQRLTIVTNRNVLWNVIIIGIVGRTLFSGILLSWILRIAATARSCEFDIAATLAFVLVSTATCTKLLHSQ